MHNIDELLSSSAPARLSDDATVRARVTSLVGASKHKPRRRWALVAIPVAAVGVLALTAGALVVNTITSDVTVPLTITTTEGTVVSCSADLAAGAENLFDEIALTEFVRNHNWSGLGQRAYTRALASDQALEIAWIQALDIEVSEQIPNGLFGMGSAWTSVSENCDWQ